MSSAPGQRVCFHDRRAEGAGAARVRADAIARVRRLRLVAGVYGEGGAVGGVAPPADSATSAARATSGRRRANDVCDMRNPPVGSRLIATIAHCARKVQGCP